MLTEHSVIDVSIITIKQGVLGVTFVIANLDGQGKLYLPITNILLLNSLLYTIF